MCAVPAGSCQLCLYPNRCLLLPLYVHSRAGSSQQLALEQPGCFMPEPTDTSMPCHSSA